MLLFNKDKTKLLRDFYASYRKEYVVPEGVIFLGSETFRESPIEKIVLPSTLQTLEGSPFIFSDRLKDITLYALTPPEASDGELFPKDAVIKVPAESVDEYKATAPWNFYSIEPIVNPEPDDYYDEYGVVHGPGIEIDGVVWAPVNCGYHEDNYPYGKQYQWGRKYGQGYSGPLYDAEGVEVGEISDVTVPRIEEGAVPVAVGNSEGNENVFYAEQGGDWASPFDNMLWNSGTDLAPVKTEYDPCPDGWRVPTFKELLSLCQNHSAWTTDDKGQNGYWLSGTSSYTDNAPQVFFPTSGTLSDAGLSYSRVLNGMYWSSRPYPDDDTHADFLLINKDLVDMKCSVRAHGYSVRCVQE